MGFFTAQHNNKNDENVFLTLLLALTRNVEKIMSETLTQKSIHQPNCQSTRRFENFGEGTLGYTTR